MAQLISPILYRPLYRLRKWPTTMAILVLKELSLYYLIDCCSLIDLHQYIGTEAFTLDDDDDEGYCELVDFDYGDGRDYYEEGDYEEEGEEESHNKQR